MFAAMIAKAQTRAATNPIGKLVRQPALAARNDGQGREDAPRKTTAREASRVASWDFSKVPILPPASRNRSQASHLMPAIIQPKLMVGPVDDPLEREADRVADQVMRMADPELSITPARPQLSRKCISCEREEDDSAMLHAKPNGTQMANAGEAPSIVHDALASAGRPLDLATRSFFESRFGRDFSQVHIHVDPLAAESAKRVGALAFTIGSDIVFGSGRYSPETVAGRSLLAHELTHVVQQRHASAKAAPAQSKFPIGGPTDRFERHAEDAAYDLANFGRVIADGPDSILQRQMDHTEDDVDRAARPQPQSPSGSINITETLFEEDAGNPGELQMAPDPALGLLLQRQPDIPPPPAYPDSSTWFFDFVGGLNDFASIFALTCEDGRERGFYVMWNERTNKSFAGPVAIGDPVKECAVPAEVHLGEVPPDRKPIYPVGFFHTHPLAPPGCRKLGVGPSQVDKDFAKDKGLPGIVEDTRTTNSPCSDGASFFFGPRVRS